MLMCDEAIWTVEQVANKLQVNPSTVRRLIQAGKLTAFKVGRHWRIQQPALADYIERQEEEEQDAER